MMFNAAVIINFKWSNSNYLFLDKNKGIFGQDKQKINSSV